MKRICLLLAMCVFLAGCTAPKETPEPSATMASAVGKERTFAIVVKDVENPYMKAMYAGFEKACSQLNATAVLSGPGETGQAEAIDALLERGVSAIAIAANDSGALSETLGRVLSLDIPVVSLDSMVKAEDRMAHIQQASSEVIGRVLIQAAAQIMGNEGEFAILTTTETMPNQSTWVRWMQRELSDHPDLYGKMKLVKIAYGLDEYKASGDETRALMKDYPSLKLIIAPTVVGMRAAAEVIEGANADVLLTGLGLPSEMEPYIASGLCPWMYLWNPSDVGYLAACALDALASGTLTGSVDEIFTAGELGEKIVVRSEDGGTEIVLGNPKMFDQTNVSVWAEIF